MNPHLEQDKSRLNSCIEKQTYTNKKKGKLGAFSIDSILSTSEAHSSQNSLPKDNTNVTSSKKTKLTIETL